MYCFLYLHSCCCLPAGSEANIIILSTVRSMPSSDFDPKQLRGDRSWSMEHLGFVTDPHQICVGITRSRFGLIVVGECDAQPVCITSCLVWSLHVRITISSWLVPIILIVFHTFCFGCSYFCWPRVSHFLSICTGNTRLLSCDPTWNKLLQQFKSHY